MTKISADDNLDHCNFGHQALFNYISNVLVQFEGFQVGLNNTFVFK